jgi:hypothetical protein
VNQKRLRKQKKTALSTVIMLVSAVILYGFLGQTARTADSVRVTTSFDVKMASPVLRQVSRIFSSGFGPAEISHVDQDINALRPDQPKVWQFTVQYQGKAETLEIRALLDDLGQIDLDFATGADAAPAVRAAVDGYLNSRSH